jgi:hypothetical protein
MKIAAMTLIAAMVGVAAESGQPQQKLTVYLRDNAVVPLGVHIRVFYDRVWSQARSLRTQLLAHVLVHEITHVLQGIDRHSDSGVMKAVWTGEDYSQMRVEPLPFAPEDVELVHVGLARRPR